MLTGTYPQQTPANIEFLHQKNLKKIFKNIGKNIKTLEMEAGYWKERGGGG